MNPIVYLIQVNLFLLLFYGFYRLLLRKETFNNLNRGYLVVAAVTAFAVPFLQSDLVRSWLVTQQVNEVIFTAYSPEFIVLGTTAESPILWMDVLRIGYISVVILLAVRLIINILQTNSLFSNFTDAVGGAFSFFGKIVVDESLEEHDTIYRHEEVHSKHLHSVDVILFEVIAVVCWFNPVVYFYKNAVRNIHEFIADELASEVINDKAAYATLLVSQQFKIAPSVLTNSFYKPSTIKLRIEMLLKKRSTKTALLKYGLIAPLFLTMMVLASATVIDKQGLENIAESVEVPLTELPSVSEVSLLSMAGNSKLDGEVEGYVFNSKGHPMEGVSVIIKNTNIGATTDANGYFKLAVGVKNATLTISYVGFVTKEVKINDETKISILLSKEHENVLSEMVVTGYQTNANATYNNGNKEIFTTVEQQPEFPGGVSQMYRYIGEQIMYPAKAQRANIQGKVFVKFVVKSTGEIGNIEILKGIGSGCDEEAVRVIAQMPKWNPGMQNGKPVSVYYTMPISFKLEGGNDAVAKGISAPPPPPAISLKGSGNTSESRYNVSVPGFRNNNAAKPLFIIDGVISPNSTIQNVNPVDISSINVIKGEAATNLYGKQAEDGAIQIITKKGDGLRDFTTNIYELKDALYIVDGKETTYETYHKKYGNDISKSSIFIYKSDQAVEKYGEKGKNGVVIVKTKDE